MTVENLWDYVRWLQLKANIYDDMAGKKLLVDMSVWLHRLVSVFALEAVQGNYDKVLAKLTQMVDRFLNRGVTLVCIFDGQPYPAKEQTNRERQAARLVALADAKLKLSEGDEAGARNAAKKAACIDSDLVYRVVHEVLRPKAVPYLRSLYETDGQMSFLVDTKFADAIDTIDGDLLVQAKCPVYSSVNYQTGDCYVMKPEFWLPTHPLNAQPTSKDSRDNVKKHAVSNAVASDSGHLSIAGTFSVGDRVVITGIAKNTHLNNLQGEVVLIDEQDGKPRFRVDLGDEMGERAFFPKNLRRAPELVVTVPDERKQKRPPNTLVTLRARYAIFGHGILLDYALVAGNDYWKFPSGCGIGRETAAAIVCRVAERFNAVGGLADLARECFSCKSVAASLSEETIMTQFRRAYAAIKHPVVFDPVRKIVLHANSNQLSIGTVPEANVVGRVCDLDFALTYVMCMQRDGVSHSLVRPVTHVLRPGETVPIQLQCWMVVGSRPSVSAKVAALDALKLELTKCGLSINGSEAEIRTRAEKNHVSVRKPAENMTVAEATKVLKTRDISVPKGADAARDAVRLLYQQEDTPGYGDPRLKDLTGTSLLDHLFMHGLVTLTPQEDKSIEFPAGEWHTAGSGLVLPELIVRQYFSAVGEELTGRYVSAPLKRGFARIANRAVLNNFGYHDGAGQPFCYFMMDVPASMKNLEYRVYVRCIVGKSALDGKRIITGIDVVRCGKECVAGRLGMCVHAAATLLAAAHLARVVDVFPDANLDGKGPAPTDLKCAWHLGAKQGEMYSCLRPVCYIPFTRADINDQKKSLIHPCMESSLGRGGFNPFPSNHSLRVRTEEEVKIIMREFCQWHVEDDGGRRCGYDIGWPEDFNPGQTPSDPVLLDEQLHRKWQILAGDYLMDKGFRINTLLHKFHAGSVRPTIRSRGQKQNTSDEVKHTKKVANVRIYVEHDNRRAREFHRFNDVTPISRLDLASDEVWVSYFLSNMQRGCLGASLH